jgi:hypothetical protein
MPAAARALAKLAACRDMHDSLSEVGMVAAISALLLRADVEPLSDPPKGVRVPTEEGEEGEGPGDDQGCTEPRCMAAALMLLGVIGACASDLSEAASFGVASKLSLDVKPRLGIDSGDDPSLISSLIVVFSAGAQRGELCELVVRCIHALILCCHARVGSAESAELALCIKKCLVMSNNTVKAHCFELIELLAATPITAHALIAARVHEALRPLGEAASSALQSLPTYCSHCFKTADEVGHSLLRCSRCRQANYCSAQCQRADFTFHRGLCGTATPP